jgi:hypothetical protein
MKLTFTDTNPRVGQTVSLSQILNGEYFYHKEDMEDGHFHIYTRIGDGLYEYNMRTKELILFPFWDGSNRHNMWFMDEHGDAIIVESPII